MNTRFRTGVLITSLILAPSAVLADASVAAPASDRCSVATQTAMKQVAGVGAIRDKQLTALGNASRRLDNLIVQASSQGHTLQSLASSNVELKKRTSALSASYSSLIEAVTATGKTCGAPVDQASGLAKLHAVKSDVSNIRSWYQTTLTPQLAQATSK